MERFIFNLILFLSAILSLKAQEAESLFPYPNIPESLTTLDDRSNYLISHFWDRCNLKTAFYSEDKFKKAFNDYIGVVPYAHLDTVNASVTKLIDEVKKQPQNLLTLGEIAQEALYGDSAQYWSDELYLPFAKAIVECRKISKENKARYKYHIDILSNSLTGQPAYPLQFENQLGEKLKLNEIVAPYIILIINETDCDDCIMARARLSTNFKIQQLINEGTLKIVSINPVKADNEWKQEVLSYPEKWVKGASANIDNYFDMRMTPSIYLLDKDKIILAKNINIETLISTISRL